MADPIFKVEGISKQFGTHTVLDNVSLEIEPGEIIGLIGSSGAGKTTFLNMLIGFIRPDKGDVKFRQDHLLSYRGSCVYHSVYSRQHMVKKVYGFASQVPSFYEELTVIENLKYFGMLHNLNNDAISVNSNTLLHLMDLTYAKDVLAKNLSGGMERRLDIACALMHDPEVLVLDEPTADLDPLLRSNIWQIIKKINQKGTTIILSSHHLTELENLCSKVAIIKDSKLLAFDKPENLKKKFVMDQEISIQTHPGKYALIAKSLDKKHISRIQATNQTLHIFTHNPEGVLAGILSTLNHHKEKLTYIKVASASLDDVFVSIWKDSEKNKEDFELE